ncbi:hypothetical protein AAY473_026085 [Plecturocebus cupreus]
MKSIMVPLDSEEENQLAGTLGTRTVQDKARIACSKSILYETGSYSVTQAGVLVCSGVIIAYCNLKLLGSNNLCTSAS